MQSSVSNKRNDLLGNPTQLGFVCRNAKIKSEELSNLLGLDSWQFEVWPPQPVRSDWESFYRGIPTKWEAIMGFSYFNDLEVEVIQVTSGRCAYTDHIDSVGEGLHHIQYRVLDLSPVIEHFSKQKIAPILGASGRKPGTRWLLFDTYRELGFYTEVLQILK